MNPLVLVMTLLRGLFACRLSLVAENLALRQQLAVLNRSSPRPRLRWRDRAFWVLLSRLWTGWRSVLVLVQPETVVRWHRRGFRYYWHWKSGKPGRPMIDPAVRRLIGRMARENPLWGAPRIQAELALLGHDLAESTVAKYMPRNRKPPSPMWRTFLDNHVGVLASIDFFVVPTATFRLLYGFLVLRHDRRQVVHFNVTAHPTAAWVKQQIREAFPFDIAPRYLIRDRDGIFGGDFGQWLKTRGIEQVLSAPRSPWQNPFVERLIGTLRRECLDHMIVLGERHLYHILKQFFAYYHEARCHQSLDRNSPVPREVEPPAKGRVVADPHLGGLHHRYRRAA
jgi:transposase InsO family protein